MGPMVAYCIPPSSIKQINTLQVPACLNALVEKLEIFKKQNARFFFFKYRYDGYQFLTEKTIFHILQLDRILK